jgi:hypothetical protein
MKGFHSRDGFYFERLEDGTVRVSLCLHGLANTGRADQAPVAVVVRSVDLPENEWASVVASVSSLGDTGENWQRARDFHFGEKLVRSSES